MEELRAMLGAREKFYAQASISVDTSRLTPDEVTDTIARRIRGAHGPGAR